MDKDKKLMLNVDTYFKLLNEDDDEMICELDLLYFGKNSNNTNLRKEIVLNNIETFYNKPIVFLTNIFSNDFKEHNRNKLSNKMPIAGNIIREGGYSIVERDGKEYLRMTAIIHKVYVPDAYEILKNRNGNIKISIELKAKDTFQLDDGSVDMNSMCLRGVCLLGEDYVEGIEGSQLNVIKFSNISLSNKQINYYKDVYMKFSKNANIEDNNIFNKIRKNQKGGEDMELSINELQKSIYNIINDIKYNDNGYDYNKYYVEEIYYDSKLIVMNDCESVKYYIVHFNIDENNIVSLDLENRTEIEKFDIRPIVGEEKSETFTFAKKEYGTGEEISVDKSKEAMSDTEWGSVDKTALRHKVLLAKNYKSLVNDVYMLVEDDWEDSPSSKLSYPVMQYKDNKFVYNRYGISSALGYAKANKENSVVTKIESLYKELEIDSETEKEDNTTEQKYTNEDMEVKFAEIRNEINNEWEQKFSSEKADWELTYKELEAKYGETLKALEGYVSKEAELEKLAKMSDYVAKFKCIQEGDINELNNYMKNCTYEEFVLKVDDKVKDFAMKFSNEEKPKVIIGEQYTVGLPINYYTLKDGTKNSSELDGLIERGKKITGIKN